MIFTIDDLSDRNERDADRRQRAAHDRDLALSPASGSWWRTTLVVDTSDEDRDEDELALAPDGVSVRRRVYDLPDNVPAFRPRPVRTWPRDKKEEED